MQTRRGRSPVDNIDALGWVASFPYSLWRQCVDEQSLPCWGGCCQREELTAFVIARFGYLAVGDGHLFYGTLDEMGSAYINTHNYHAYYHAYIYIKSDVLFCSHVFCVEEGVLWGRERQALPL